MTVLAGVARECARVPPRDTRGCRSGGRTTATTRQPEEPERAGRDERPGQPKRIVIHGTTSGVTIAPTFVPALKMPVASARSRRGNHSATVLIDAGETARLAEAEQRTARR